MFLENFKTIKWETEEALASGDAAIFFGPAGDLNGLYRIDFMETSIPDNTDPFWVNVFGLFLTGKVDR